ncbi:MAG: hypothetical protein ABSC17_01725 [Thermacetogeniaceae bacterium]
MAVGIMPHHDVERALKLAMRHEVELDVGGLSPALLVNIEQIAELLHRDESGLHQVINSSSSGSSPSWASLKSRLTNSITTCSLSSGIILISSTSLSLVSSKARTPFWDSMPASGRTMTRRRVSAGQPG